MQITSNPLWVSFSKDLKALNFRKPNKILIEKLGFNRSQVSDYITGKKIPSENFLQKFYKTFQEQLEIIEEANKKTFKEILKHENFMAEANNDCKACINKAIRIKELEGQVALLKEILQNKTSTS